MTRIVSTAAATALALALASTTASAEGLYLGASLGSAFYNDQDLPGGQDAQIDTGGDISVLIGYDFGPQSFGAGVRAELQFSGQGADAKGDVDGEYLTGATFLNVLVDFDATGAAKWVPYVGAGIGHGVMEFDGYTTGAGDLQDGTAAVWGAQAIVGVAYRMTDHVRLSADLRHRMWADAEITDGAGVHHDIATRATTVHFGVAYAF